MKLYPQVCDFLLETRDIGLSGQFAVLRFRFFTDEEGRKAGGEITEYSKTKP